MKECPCCDTHLSETSVRHELNAIFNTWKAYGVEFSEETYKGYPGNLFFTLHKCPNCGFGAFLPLAPGTASFYKDVTRNDYYLTDRWDFRTAVKILQKHKAGSVLDIGCGMGAFLNLARQSMPKAELHGLDVNPAVRDALPEGVFLHASLEGLERQFDMVTLFQVLEHTDTPLEMLDAAVERVRPGGFLVVSTPNSAGPIRFFADSHTEIPPHHVTQWTCESLALLAGKCGLRVLAVKKEPLPHYLFPFYAPEILLRALGAKGNPRWEPFVRRYVAAPLLAMCSRLSVRSLPVTGHTCLLLAQRPQSD